MPWNVTDPNTGDHIVNAGGVEYTYPSDTPFVDAVKDAALRAGMGKFRVFIDTREIDNAADAPDLLEDVDSPIILQRYDVAG